MPPGPRRSTGSSPTTRKRRPRLGDVPMKVGSGKATIIRGGRLLDIRAHRADPADLLIVGDTIREVGVPGLKAPAGASVIDARGKLLHPGLINAHTHGHGNLAKGMGDRWTLELLLTAGSWINGGRSLEDKYLSTKLGAVEMVLKGCTAAYDLAFEWPAPTPEGLSAVGRAYADDGMRACVDLAKEHDAGLHTHVAESKVQAVVGLQRYGKTLTAHLDDLDVLGPRFTVAHGVWLDGDEMKRLGDHGASVAHNPGSNMRLGNGLADMRGMLERRVNVGVGTDGANCSDNLNMYEAMRLASLVSKGQTPDLERWVTTEEVVLAATEGGARALGFGGKIGRLAPGYKADIVFLDLGHVNWLPCNDPTNQLVHTEDGGAVESVMIGGRMIVEQRRVTTVDMAALARDVEAARARLARVNAPGKALYERLAVVVGRFCPGLAHVPYHVDRYVGSDRKST